MFDHYTAIYVNLRSSITREKTDSKRLVRSGVSAEYEYSKDEELEGLAEAEEAKRAEAEAKAEAKRSEAEAQPEYDPEVGGAFCMLGLGT